MKKVNPRHGSMQVWPRKRAKREQPRIRSRPVVKEAVPIGFAGYKVGMTHVQAIDAYKNSITKGQEISVPVTIIECPPLRIHSLRCYVSKGYGFEIANEIFFKGTKYTSRRVTFKVSSPDKLDNLNLSDYHHFSITLSTQPNLTGLKKTPEIFELPVGGSNEDVINFVKENKEKDIKVSEILKEGDIVDFHAITKGKGYQGSVKRFGIGLKSHKSEKGQRAPGSISGGWVAQGHMMWRVAFPGQMGYHQRTQYNSQVFKMSDKPEEINPSGDFVRYGKVKSDYILVAGSVPGPKKRFVVFTKAIRPTKIIRPVPTISEISLASQQ